jgi:hypothetical protein
VTVILAQPQRTNIFRASSGQVIVSRVGTPGPQGPAGADGTTATFDAENKSGGTLSAGIVVATHSSGSGTVKAIATAFGTLAIGLAAESTLSSVSGEVQTSGSLTLSDWTAITGATELVARGRYYLSAATAGLLTTTAPSTVGHIIQLVGVAISPSTLDIDPGEGILL